MKMLFAATPVAGHLNPLLAVVRMARAAGHEAVLTTATYLESAVETAGARFRPLGPGADLDLSRVEEVWPERASLPPGPAQLRFDFERVFLDMMPPQAETLRALVAEEKPDVVIVDSFFFGATALFLDRRVPRPPIVALGITVMVADRPDGAPSVLGLPPARDAVDRARYAAILAEVEESFLRPVSAYADAKLAAMGLPRLPGNVLHSRNLVADAVLLPTVPAFEYDFGPLPPHIRFVGALPPPPFGAAEPDWWDELEADTRTVVLVTQGTVANADFGELVEPTLAALGGRDDCLIVVTTGNRPLENVGGPIPANARMALFLDYQKLLPKVDVIVTNGGYGTVSLALQAGVPIVAAGRTEDKAEVGARVAWSGVGVEIPSQTPSEAELRDAVDRVLSEPRFRQRARELAADFARLDASREIFGVIDALVRKDQETWAKRGAL